ncbi:hypothetical protein RGQ13_00515 [Thalassotalea psychrophila]|uniref:DUF1353 domain-containing protein n=1 Tax=Thalassotalea psychrophila TaxID=3065647 RepID=A0ABY9TUM0_9GAMM|nr:hypothetical protein RGQ13_00515 [Colwelliaceae bacterium SQ149]
MSTYPEPKHKQKKGNYPYIFKIKKDFSIDSGWCLENDFDSKWLKISKDGLVIVKASNDGYSWDGCTPKWSFFNLFVFGVPDGHYDHRTDKKFTQDASLVHDALYQYLDTIPVTKKQVDDLFLVMLGDFKLRYIYYVFVRVFGDFKLRYIYNVFVRVFGGRL